MSLPTYPSPEGHRWAAPRKARTPVAWYDVVLGLAAPWGVAVVAFWLTGARGAIYLPPAFFLPAALIAGRIRHLAVVWSYLAGLLSIFVTLVVLFVTAVEATPG